MMVGHRKKRGILMRTLMKITLLVTLLVIGMGTMFATTTDELMITVGGVSATFTDNVFGCVGAGCGALIGDLNPFASTTTVSGSLGGWTISITSGTSNSPGFHPFGLDVTSLTATCVGGGCTANPLDIQYTDINFNPAYPGFVTAYSTTMVGAGSTSESAYFDNANALFAETTLIGTVGPFIATGHGTVSGGVGAVAPYSLTLDQVFTAAGGPVSFSSDGSISVPEPGAVMLFGTVLVLCASKLRRRRAS